jgi:hypothetical protein
MTEPLIACTLPLTDVPDRLALIRALADEALLDHRPIDGGVRWRFRDATGVEARVREVAQLESRCCGFLAFQVRRDADAIVLDITGPSEARNVMEAFFAG